MPCSEAGMSCVCSAWPMRMRMRETHSVPTATCSLGRARASQQQCPLPLPLSAAAQLHAHTCCTRMHACRCVLTCARSSMKSEPATTTGPAASSGSQRATDAGACGARYPASLHRREGREVTRCRPPPPHRPQRQAACTLPVTQVWLRCLPHSNEAQHGLECSCNTQPLAPTIKSTSANMERSMHGGLIITTKQTCIAGT